MFPPSGQSSSLSQLEITRILPSGLAQTSNPYGWSSSHIERTREHSLTQLGEESSKKDCYGAIMQMDLKREMFVVGDIFMRKYYTVFDRQNDRVGLAEAIKP